MSPNRASDPNAALRTFIYLMGKEDAMPMLSSSALEEWMVKNLMSVFKTDVGGLLIQTRTNIKTTLPKGFRLASLIDTNQKVPPQIKKGQIFTSKADTPEYLREVWRISPNPTITPTPNLGIDAWFPLYDIDGLNEIKGAFFLDATDEEFDIYPYNLVIHGISMFYSQLYRRHLEIVALSKKQEKKIESLKKK